MPDLFSSTSSPEADGTGALPPAKARKVGSPSIVRGADAALLAAAAMKARWSSLVLVEVTSTSPDYIKPWKMHSQRSCKGSGFVIEGGRILTNYHVVQDAIDVRLRKHGVSRRWRGTVLARGPDVDLALLAVHEDEEGRGDSFWNGVTPAVWCSTLPALQSAVHVIGFPTGGTTISVTQGVVSRVDCKNYRVGSSAFANSGGLLVLQIDAAINAGNSGGPAFCSDGSVVGVAFQSLGGAADGIGYLIPTQVCLNFLAAVAGGEYKGISDVPFLARELRNASLRRRHRVPDDVTGVLVTRASSHSALGVRVDDVVLSIDGKKVGDDGSVELRESELVSYEFLLTGKQRGEPTSVLVLRGGERVQLCAPLSQLPRRLPRNHGFDCFPHYVIIGGLVFVRLCCPMLEDKRSKGHHSAIYDLVNYQIARSFPPADGGGEGGEVAEILLLTEILAAPLNYGYTCHAWRVLDTLNGQRPKSLRALHQMYRAVPDGAFLEFVFSHGGDQIVLDATECRQSEPDILQLHAIPSATSDGLQGGGEEPAAPAPAP